MSLRKVTSLGSYLASVTYLKRIQTPHSLCCDFRGYKTFTICWSGGRVQVWVQVWAPACHLAISLKAVPEGNQRYRGQNQQPSSWGRSPALLGLVRLASTNTRCFQVCCSCCWQWPACLRKTCYHSCYSSNTESVQESKKLFMPCKFLAATSQLFHVKWKFQWNQLEVVAYQSSSHCLAQSFYQWLVSE